MARQYKAGTYWTVEFNTGEFGSRFANQRAAQGYADAANRYSEQHHNERVVRSLVQYKNFERVKTVPA